MISHKQLREYIIKPTLAPLLAYSEEAEELLILTVAQESLGGKYIHQLGGGPAVGIYQMEPATHDDIWENYLEYKEDLSDKVHSVMISPEGPDATEMIGNLYYATAMARVHYLRVPVALPQANNIDELARYYKQHYNTEQGAAEPEEAVENYLTYLDD